MSGHSHPSGGPSQRLDTRRSQIRGIVDEPQSCRLKMRITETQGQRESPMDRKSERNPYRKKTREGGAQNQESLIENQRRTPTRSRGGKPGDRNSGDGPKDRQKQRHRASQSRETPVPTHSPRETQTQRQTEKDRDTGTQRK